MYELVCNFLFMQSAACKGVSQLKNIAFMGTFVCSGHGKVRLNSALVQLAAVISQVQHTLRLFPSVISREW